MNEVTPLEDLLDNPLDTSKDSIKDLLNTARIWMHEAPGTYIGEMCRVFISLHSENVALKDKLGGIDHG